MSTRVEYLPGDRWLVAGATAIVQLAGESADALRWWPAVRGGVDAAELIGQVYTDGVLGSHTPLVIVCTESGRPAADPADPADPDRADGAGVIVRVLAQGDVSVMVETVAGQRVTVTGRKLLTWSELVITDVATVYLECPDALPAAGELLPMPAGVVRSGAVRWQLADLPPSAVEAEGPAASLLADDEPAESTADEPATEPAVAEPVSAKTVAARTVAAEPERPSDEQALSETPGPAVTTAPGAPTAPAAALAALAAESAQAGKDADITQLVPQEDVEDATEDAPRDAAQDTAADQREGENRSPAMVPGQRSDHPPADDSLVSPGNPFPSVVLPPFSPPPFVPAVTSLPPISGVPGGAAANDPGVPTGLPPQRTGDSESFDQPSAGIAAGLPSEGYPAGDHDGHTQLAEEMPAGYTPPPMPPAPAAGQVYAALCPTGHPNAPHTGNCRICGVPIAAAEPVLTGRPVLGRIRLSTGPVVDVYRRVVIGRAPSASRVSSSELPQLVTVPSPHQDISRSHVEIRAEDWHLVVADLNSTNGTVVRIPGRPEQLLHPGQAVVVEVGWLVDLGDGVTFTVENPTLQPTGGAPG